MYIQACRSFWCLLVFMHAANGVSPFISILPPTPITFIIDMPSLHGCDSETTCPSAYLPVKWPSKFQSLLWLAGVTENLIWAYTALGVFFFGRIFDLVSGWQHICACVVPYPLCTMVFEKGVLNMIEKNGCQEDCGCKSYSSGDFKHNKELQPITTMCLQWTVNKTGKYLATVQFLLSPLEIIC